MYEKTRNVRRIHTSAFPRSGIIRKIFCRCVLGCFKLFEIFWARLVFVRPYADKVCSVFIFQLDFILIFLSNVAKSIALRFHNGLPSCSYGHKSNYSVRLTFATSHLPLLWPEVCQTVCFLFVCINNNSNNNSVVQRNNCIMV